MKIQDRYDSLFFFYARAGITPLLLKAQAMQESDLNPAAYNTASGCKGLAQFADATFAEVAAEIGLKRASVWNPEHAIAAQSAYMFHLRKIFSDTEKALAAYNYGMGNVGRIKDEPDWKDKLPWETKHYLIKIAEYQKELGI